MKIITNGDGMARDANPYEHIKHHHDGDTTELWDKWDKEHPPLPLIDQNGNEVKQAGEFEVEKIWQWYCTYTEKNDKGQSFGPKVSKWRAVPNYNNNMNNLAESLSRGGRQTRQVYRLTSPIVSNPGKGDSIWDSETQTGHYSRPVHHREMMYKTPSAPQPIENESGKLAEMVEEQAQTNLYEQFKGMTLEKLSPESQRAESIERVAEKHYLKNHTAIEKDGELLFVKGAIFGAQWQASQPNLISREAVTEILKTLAILFEECLSDFDSEGDEMSSAEENTAATLKKYQHIYNPVP